LRSPAGLCQHLRLSETFARRVLSIFFVTAGAMHFVVPEIYIRIVPPNLPSPALIVLISGIAEIAGGLGLLFPLTRRAAAWGLVIILLAVFPANIYMAAAHLPFAGLFGKSWLQWLRLPLQFPLIYWTYLYTRKRTVPRRVEHSSA